MGFSGIGIWEIVLIIVVILLVLGPHRLPEIGRTLGRAFRAIKKASSDLSLNITKEIEENKTAKPTAHATPSPPAKPAATAEKASPASESNPTDQNDQSQKSGGASAEK
ncbi:MAG TPA: twin-arginine translocase TatA/TatE family subunit [Dehalococcoidia bacterium]|nr:twin-arginine translocase TatA/TatE family subunit [Dehalococcoidia bacterium]